MAVGLLQVIGQVELVQDVAALGALQHRGHASRCDAAHRMRLELAAHRCRGSTLIASIGLRLAQRREVDRVAG